MFTYIINVTICQLENFKVKFITYYLWMFKIKLKDTIKNGKLQMVNRYYI